MTPDASQTAKLSFRTLSVTCSFPSWTSADLLVLFKELLYFVEWPLFQNAQRRGHGSWPSCSSLFLASNPQPQWSVPSMRSSAVQARRAGTWAWLSTPHTAQICADSCTVHLRSALLLPPTFPLQTRCGQRASSAIVRLTQSLKKV